jgi:tetratricopeptide (TPR) repeat protein
VLCTSHSVVPAKLAREVELQAKRLRDQRPEVAFSVWDASALSDELKEYPQLVRDFFGQAWLERFLPAGEWRPPAAVPQQLPPLLGEFVNRRRDLGKVDTAVTRAGEGAPPIVVLTGGHGVGKTATCRKWAHANVDRFADGQLYADFSELRQRGGVAVGDVLSRFLRAFGVPDEVIPRELEERSAMFRSRIAGKRVLVMLDDVDHVAQVRPLIPNTASGAVLLTSRARLEELVVFDGARLVRLRPLDEDSAEELLARMVGEERVGDDPDAVETLVAICGGLPVALRICGARLASHESRPVSWLVAELADEAVRLERIGTEPDQSLQVVFDEAYRALGPGGATMYRRLGLHPGPSFTLGAAAATAGQPLELAVRHLDELAAVHLLEDLGDRFSFHDLLRLHARGAAARDEPVEEQDAAVERCVAFYLRAAQRMDHATIPNRLRLTDGPPPPAAGEPSPGSPAEAFACFETERANLMAVLRAAGERELDTEAWQMGEALFLAYHNHKHPVEAVEVYEIATEASRRAGHLEAEVRMLSQLALAHLDIGEFGAADAELERCRGLMERSANRQLWASIREWTGVLEVARGNYDRAVGFYEQAREAFEAAGTQRGVALQEMGIGQALHLAGRSRSAIAPLTRAGELLDRDADALTYGRAVLRLGEAYRALGDREHAQAALEQAVEAMRESGAPLLEASAREALAELAREGGDTRAAASHLRRALSIYSALSSPRADLVGARLDEIASGTA